MACAAIGAGKNLSSRAARVQDLYGDWAIGRRSVTHNHRVRECHVLAQVGRGVWVLSIACHLWTHAKGVQLPPVISNGDGIGVHDLAALHIDEDPTNLGGTLAACGRQDSGHPHDQQQGSHYNMR